MVFASKYMIPLFCPYLFQKITTNTLTHTQCKYLLLDICKSSVTCMLKVKYPCNMGSAIYEMSHKISIPRNSNTQKLFFFDNWPKIELKVTLNWFDEKCLQN